MIYCLLTRNLKIHMKVTDCWYNTVCSKFPDECNNRCVRFLEMLHLCKNSNLPESRWVPEKLSPGKDLEAYKKLHELKSDPCNFVESGKSLIIYSNYTGNGKTSWAIKLMLAYFNQIWNGNGFQTRALFIPTHELLFNLKQSFSSKDVEINDLFDKIKTVDLVIWDDIGSSKLSEYDIGILFNLIDARVTASKSSIYTTNAMPDNMQAILGGRLFSRVFQQSLQIHFKDGDRRAMKGGPLLG